MAAINHSTMQLKALPVLFIFFLAGLIFLVYSSNLDGPFIFDDSRIQNNPQLHVTDLSLHNLIKAGFESSPKTRPVAYISFALNYYFHDFQTQGYHLVNICIHALAAILLFLLIRTTLGLEPLRAKYGPHTWLPFAAALIWAVHPLQTQSVSYIIQRMNSLSAMFYIMSVYLYARGRLASVPGRKWLLVSGAVLAGLLALGSKETAATLPFFIFLYEWFFFQDMDFIWLKRQVIPGSLALLAFMLLVLLYLGTNPLETITVSYSNREFTLSQRLLTEPRIVVFYISLVLFPYPGRLNLDHHIIPSTGFFSPTATIISAMILLFLVIAALASAKKQRLTSFCLIWFLGNLVIESSFLGLELIFEHRNYLPSMMLVLLVLTLILPILKHSWLKIVFLCLVVLTLSVWTFERNRAWNDRISIWGDSAAKSPAKARPHNNFGVALKDKGRLDSATGNFKQTILLDPKFTEAYNNLGNTYMLLGKYDEALHYYRRGLDISPENPLIHVNLANTLVKHWELEEALLHYGEALRLNPDYEEAHLNFLSTRRMIEARKLRRQ